MPVTDARATPSPRRQHLALAALADWLDARGAEPAQRDAALRSLASALHDGAGGQPGLLDQLIALVAERTELSTWRDADARRTLAAALARSVLAQASAEVETEAARAGHIDVFRALLPWLGRPLPDAVAQRIAGERGLAAAALDRALTRLRRRWRQRIDAGLALCSDAGAGREELRARLHAALVSGENPS